MTMRMQNCLLFFLLTTPISGWSPPQVIQSRRQAFAGAAVLAGLVPQQQPAFAASPVGAIDDATLQAIVESDITERQFLATGNLTRSIYLPTATFTDEIDTYGLEEWMKGTQRLFVGAKSQVRLVGEGVTVQPDKITFRFDEDLMFNIPLNPVVSITGRVDLVRDKDSGRIASYQEFWDQDVWTVIKTAKFK